MASPVETNSIRRWIEDRPDRQRALLFEGLQRDADGFRCVHREVAARLYGADLSVESYQWCIETAKSMSETKPEVAESLVLYVLQSGRIEPSNMQELLREDKKLSSMLARLLAPPTSPESDRLEDRRQAVEEERRETEQEFVDYLMARRESLRANQAPPALLYQLARTYFGDFLDFQPEWGGRNLQLRLKSNPDLLDAALVGLRLTLERYDVPDPEEVLELKCQSRMHYLCWPYLASLGRGRENRLVDALLVVCRSKAQGAGLLLRLSPWRLRA